jgi:hypothetical protein
MTKMAKVLKLLQMLDGMLKMLIKSQLIQAK